MLANSIDYKKSYAYSLSDPAALRGEAGQAQAVKNKAQVVKGTRFLFNFKFETLSNVGVQCRHWDVPSTGSGSNSYAFPSINSG